jgi:hypothetical protein
MQRMQEHHEPIEASIKAMFSGSADVAEDEGEGEVVWDVRYDRYGLTAWRRAVGGQIYVLQDNDLVKRWGADFYAELITTITRGEVIAYGSDFS